MPNINEIILILEGFQYDTSFYLNMECFHIQLIEDVSNLCTIILPWVKYHYTCLPMGVNNSPYIFQQNLNNLFHIFYFICAYIDDLLILTKVYWTYHVGKLELTVNKMEERGLKFDIEGSFFRKIQIEYLGFWVTCDAVKPLY